MQLDGSFSRPDKHYPKIGLRNTKNSENKVKGQEQLPKGVFIGSQILTFTSTL